MPEHDEPDGGVIYVMQSMNTPAFETFTLHTSYRWWRRYI